MPDAVHILDWNYFPDIKFHTLQQLCYRQNLRTTGQLSFPEEIEQMLATETVNWQEEIKLELIFLSIVIS